MIITYKIKAGTSGMALEYTMHAKNLDEELKDCKNYEEEKRLIRKYVIDALTAINTVENKSAKIKELAQIEFDTKNAVNDMSVVNIADRPYEELKQMAVHYAIAKRNHFIAERNLSNATKGGVTR